MIEELVQRLQEERHIPVVAIQKLLRHNLRTLVERVNRDAEEYFTYPQ